MSVRGGSGSTPPEGARALEASSAAFSELILEAPLLDHPTRAARAATLCERAGERGTPDAASRQRIVRQRGWLRRRLATIPLAEPETRAQAAMALELLFMLGATPRDPSSSPRAVGDPGPPPEAEVDRRVGSPPGWSGVEHTGVDRLLRILTRAPVSRWVPLDGIGERACLSQRTGLVGVELVPEAQLPAAGARVGATLFSRWALHPRGEPWAGIAGNELILGMVQPGDVLWLERDPGEAEQSAVWFLVARVEEAGLDVLTLGFRPGAVQGWANLAWELQ